MLHTLVEPPPEAAPRVRARDRNRSNVQLSALPYTYGYDAYDTARYDKTHGHWGTSCEAAEWAALAPGGPSVPNRWVSIAESMGKGHTSRSRVSLQAECVAPKPQLPVPRTSLSAVEYVPFVSMGGMGRLADSATGGVVGKDPDAW